MFGSYTEWIYIKGVELNHINFSCTVSFCLGKINCHNRNCLKNWLFKIGAILFLSQFEKNKSEKKSKH
jgi:hypothetical protein